MSSETKDQWAIKWRTSLAEVAEIIGMKCGDDLTDVPAKLREFIASQRKVSDNYIPSNTAGLLPDVTYSNTRDTAALASVSGGFLYVDGQPVDFTPCLIQPGSTVRAVRSIRAGVYSNFFAVMEWPTNINQQSIGPWRVFG